jgi:hypothetical protein
MKNNVFKLYLLSFFLFTDFISFAQPGQDQPGGGLEGDDPSPAPINGKLIVLAVAAVLFAFYTLKNRRKEIL